MDRGTKALQYIAEITVNGNEDVKSVNPNVKFRNAIVPDFNPYAEYPKGSKDRLKDLGREGFTQWLKNEKYLHNCALKPFRALRNP